MTTTQPRPQLAPEEPLRVVADDVEDRSDDVARAMGELASLLVADESIETTLNRIADLARATIPGCDAAGVTLLDGDRFVTAAWTDGQTLAVDDEQYKRDHGPCLEAMREQRIVRVSVDGAAARWPDFAAAARQAGIRSFLAAPLVLAGEGLGSLNLYSRSVDGFERLDDALVAMYGAQATVALANVRVYTQAVSLAAQLETALTSRAPIEQAKGILMARLGCSDAEAFRALRKLSQHRHLKVREVALEVVTEAQRVAATTAMPADSRESVS